MESPTEPGQSPDVSVDALTTQVFKQVVMCVDAVQTGVTRQRLVQVREVIVDEMRKWLRWVHTRMLLSRSAAPWGAPILAMVQ